LTIRATLCFIVKDNRVLLLKKSEGLFGAGKWNAPGGKIHDGEDPLSCAVRETFEETNVRVVQPEHVGIVHFYKYDKRGSPDWTAYVFLARKFEGNPVDGREGVTRWFNLNALPFHEMWEDDRYWHRLVFEGKRFEAWFYYSGDFEKLVDFKIEELTATTQEALRNSL
jgi:8-oxo-dGTP diphosphatase